MKQDTFSNPKNLKLMYKTTFSVRDYECDLQGIVNHANYLHYFEHTRHLYLNHLGKSFQQWHQEGFDLVVSNLSINYKDALKSGDSFQSLLYISEKKRTIITFFQQLIRSDNHCCVTEAYVRCGCLKEGTIHKLPFESLFEH